MNELLSLINDQSILKSLIFSVGLFVLFSIVRVLIFRSINRSQANVQEKAQSKRRVSQTLLLLFLLSILILWFAKIQGVLVSIFAVAAAIVLAFKEMIMCFTGGLLINISSIFKVGQRIEVDSIRGFVIEKGMLSTKILEIGPEKHSQQTTGDVISIPNSLMLSKTLKNESYFRGYSIKSFIFKVTDETRVEEFEQALGEVATQICESYLDQATKSIYSFCEKEGLNVPNISPRTKVLIEDSKDFSVLIKLPVKNDQIADVEQELNRFYLQWRIMSK